MTISIFLAKLIGPVFLAVGIGLIANTAAYRRLAEEFLRSNALIYLSGLLTMTAGVALVLTHNVWVADWRIMITILGWLAAIGGAVCIIAPQGAQTIGHWMMARPSAFMAAAAVWLAVGALLSFFSYFR